MKLLIILLFACITANSQSIKEVDTLYFKRIELDVQPNNGITVTKIFTDTSRQYFVTVDTTFKWRQGEGIGYDRLRDMRLDLDTMPLDLKWQGWQVSKPEEDRLLRYDTAQGFIVGVYKDGTLKSRKAIQIYSVKRKSVWIAGVCPGFGAGQGVGLSCAVYHGGGWQPKEEKSLVKTISEGKEIEEGKAFKFYDKDNLL